MAKKAKGMRVSWKQLLVALALTVSVAYSVAITDVVSRSVRTRRRVDALLAEVQALEDEKAKLQRDLEVVESDLYAESVARQELKWRKAGETAFVPILKQTAPTVAPQSLPRPTPVPTGSASPVSRWQELMQLLFGLRAP